MNSRVYAPKSNAEIGTMKSIGLHKAERTLRSWCQANKNEHSLSECSGESPYTQINFISCGLQVEAPLTILYGNLRAGRPRQKLERQFEILPRTA